MNKLFTVVQTELYKAMKAKTIWLTALLLTLIPLVGSFFMYVLKDPVLAKASGLLGTKAQIAGEANWPSFIMLQSQMIAVGGMIAYGFILSWIFGREFAQLTAKDLLALPQSRTLIVFGKYLASFIINIGLSLYVISLSFLFGYFLNLPKWEIVPEKQLLQQLILVTLLTIILMTPVAFFATIGRGYLLAIGFMIVLLISSQLITVIGYGELFPWAIPALMSGMVEEISFKLTIKHWLLLGGTSLAGILLTIYSWLYIDYSP